MIDWVLIIGLVFEKKKRGGGCDDKPIFIDLCQEDGPVLLSDSSIVAVALPAIPLEEKKIEEEEEEGADKELYDAVTRNLSDLRISPVDVEANKQKMIDNLNEADETVVEPTDKVESEEEEEEEAVVAENQPTIITIVGNSFATNHVDIKKMVVEKEGFVYSQTLTKATTYLISSDMPPTESAQKVIQARKYGVPIRGPLFLAGLLNVDAI